MTTGIVLACLIGSFVVSFCLAVIFGMALRTQRLEAIATDIYLAGFWKAEGVSAQRAAELWTRFRDEFRIPPGTATSAGVGDRY